MAVFRVGAALPRPIRAAAGSGAVHWALFPAKAWRRVVEKHLPSPEVCRAAARSGTDGMLNMTTMGKVVDLFL